MDFTMVQALRNAVDWVLPDSTHYRGVLIPAKHVRLCGKNFLSNEYFFSSAIEEAERCVEHLGLKPKSRVLDVGCGVGRLPIGILERVGEIARYVGIDVRGRAIRWCAHYISPLHPTFQFIWLDVKNLRYNPQGKNLDHGFRFPLEDREFDIIYLYSVFTHMMDDDVSKYLSEFRRIFDPEGKIFLTAFIEEGVPNVSVNPKHYRKKWKGALHCVRYNRDFFERLVDDAGFVVERFDYAREMNGASGLYLSLRNKNPQSTE